MEDPFFVVQDEVLRSLEKAKALLSHSSGPWLEARNALRSIEWDLEDLQDTLNILNENPEKFGLDNKQLRTRGEFVVNANLRLKRLQRKLAKLEHPNDVNDDVSDDVSDDDDDTKENPKGQLSFGTRTRYERVTNEDCGSPSAGSRQCNEGGRRALDVSALEELGGQIERAESKLDATMQRLSTVFSNGRDRRHWLLVGTMSSVLMVIVLIIFAL